MHHDDLPCVDPLTVMHPVPEVNRYVLWVRQASLGGVQQNWNGDDIR